MMTIGEKIQCLRKKSNLSQEQLAEHCAVTRQAVSKWELGESVPDVDKIIQLSQLFKVTTDYLLLDEQLVENEKIKEFWTSNQIRQCLVACTGINILGMIFCVLNANQYYVTMFSMGLILQVSSVVLFEYFVPRIAIKERRDVRKRFYAVNLFIFWVGPSIYVYSKDIRALFLISNYFRIEFSQYMNVLAHLSIYALLCGISAPLVIKLSKSS